MCKRGVPTQCLALALNEISMELVLLVLTAPLWPAILAAAFGMIADAKRRPAWQPQPRPMPRRETEPEAEPEARLFSGAPPVFREPAPLFTMDPEPPPAGGPLPAMRPNRS